MTTLVHDLRENGVGTYCFYPLPDYLIFWSEKDITHDNLYCLEPSSYKGVYAEDFKATLLHLLDGVEPEFGLPDLKIKDTKSFDY
jgi:hypothetical protein